MNNFRVLDNIEDSIFVLDSENNLLFQNSTSKKTFGKIENLDKIKKHFSVSACLLDTGDIHTTTPIDLMLGSKENFYAYCSYQKNQNDYVQFNMSAINENSNKIIMFKNVTNDEKCKKIENDNNELKEKLELLEKETNKYAQLKEIASDQALKMSLLNRISTVIRKSTDLSEIIESSIVEIHDLLGSFKTYYAQTQANQFKILSITPKQYNNELSQKAVFSDETINLINSKQIIFRNCIKEHRKSTETLSKNTKRVIIPIFNQTKLIGIIVSLTTQKSNLKDNIEVLESIATQLSSALIQASLIKELNKKNIKLQNMLNELKETQLQLINSEKMASLGQLVAGIAHEINTPLASINSNNSIRNKLIASENQNMIETVKELNNIDQEAIKRINNMVKSLKKFVRLDEADLQEADINNEIDLTLQLISHETKNKVEIIKNYSKLPTIKCYPNMLNQVFMNVLINAAHSIPPNKKDGKIHITTSYNKGYLIVSIKDNGVGIKKEIQNQIFNPGFTTKAAGVGSGLGLSISHKIIQKHKGKISFKSREGKGTEFIIKIPSKN